MSKNLANTTAQRNGKLRSNSAEQNNALDTKVKPRKADLTRMALIEAAERLIAKKCFADVSTREILEEAGQKNQSALQYHFGSKEGLISATINERTKQTDEVRLQMLSELDAPATMRQIFEALVYPSRDLIQSHAAGTNFIIFLAQALSRPNWSLRKVIQDFDIHGMAQCYKRYDELLHHLSEQERLLRQDAAFDLAILTYRRWCLSSNEDKASLHDITEFIIDSSLAIVEA